MKPVFTISVAKILETYPEKLTTIHREYEEHAKILLEQIGDENKQVFTGIYTDLIRGSKKLRQEATAS